VARKSHSGFSGSRAKSKKGEEDIQILKRFWREEEGQDLIEYSLLLGFIALFSASIYSTVNGDVKTIWKNASTTLNTAAS
jgi:Flp pilus assembly pilin Flp